MRSLDFTGFTKLVQGCFLWHLFIELDRFVLTGLRFGSYLGPDLTCGGCGHCTPTAPKKVRACIAAAFTKTNFSDGKMGVEEWSL